jgi:hypothetical protein
MPISDAEKKVLLERLELARVAKQKKAEEAKAAKAVKAVKPAPEPVPEPVAAPPTITPAPVPVPEERPPVSEPIDIPEVPDLVTASRKPAKGKKVALPVSDSDSDSEVVMPKKKKGFAKKDTPFLKIKLYKEPQDKVAFQNLLQAVAGEVEEEEEEVEAPAPPPPQKPYHKGPHVFHRVGATPRGAVSKSLTKEEIEATELRRLALQIFG